MLMYAAVFNDERIASFPVDSTPVMRCLLEIEPHQSGGVTLRFLENMSVVSEAAFAAEEVTSELIGKRMAAFLRRGTG